MKKILITLLVSLFFISGCTIIKVSNKSISDVFETILYINNNLCNTYMDGYQLYLPKGVKIIDKSDHNLEIKDKDNIYYLYIDTIAYYYKTENSYEVNNHFYSQKINNGNKSGYVDIVEYNDKYFVVLMYNYAKIEAYIEKDDFDTALSNMSYILSTIKYNDSVINEYVGDRGTLVQEEQFDIFSSDNEKDNFLTYEEEYGSYKKENSQNLDNEVVEIIETVE